LQQSNSDFGASGVYYNLLYFLSFKLASEHEVTSLHTAAIFRRGCLPRYRLNGHVAVFVFIK